MMDPMETQPEQEYVMYYATCRTPDCVNEGERLTVPATATSPHIRCGPCGIQIADITPIS